MELFDEPIFQVFNEEFVRRFDDREVKDRVVSSFVNWLTHRTRLKQVPDLAGRIEKFTKDCERMVEDMELKITDGKLVVTVRGSSESTLTQIRLGSDWFVGTDEIVELVMAGLYKA